ncbi:uncharacterized protein RSE6_10760 [Rhynchosporium secalis]|uniref:Peroxidase n=1 Tax=Rhynchosporium secalis TaxID=38038 RepID=A0A1E1ML88_RHYSE|nr:uncharacterized protein RSE6_10760 [Rhynchosporium secalis]
MARSLHVLLRMLQDAVVALVVCTAVWTPIISELSALFIDRSVSPSQCNDDARAAIRAAFHDCGMWDNSRGETGGCDGSLMHHSKRSIYPPRNNGLQDISTKLLFLQQKYNESSSPVSIADILQVAASRATLTCPGGPRVSTYVGRKDSSNPAPDDRLPDAHGSGQSLYELFLAKGFEAKELAALLGAHSTSKAFHQPDIPAGTPQDDTPGIWDVHYYSNTLKPVAGIQPFQSDNNLAAHPIVGKEFHGLVGSQGKWTSAYSKAMEKMSLLGVLGEKRNLMDCTGALPEGTNNKRDMRTAPISDRVR